MALEGPLAWVLPNAPTSVAKARRHVADACVGLPHECVAVAQLLTSELVANAVRYGVGDIGLRLELDHRTLRVVVDDGGPDLPVLLAPASDAPGGRGMLLVDALSAAWGVRPASTARRKAVWFTVNTVP